MKILASLRILRSGWLLDDIDASSHMGRQTISTYFYTFCGDMFNLYGPTYLNLRTEPSEFASIAITYSDACFPGCVGFITCCKIIWNNCHLELKGHYYNSKECEKRRYRLRWFAIGSIMRGTGLQGVAEETTIKIIVAVFPIFSHIMVGRYAFKLRHTYMLGPNSVAQNIPFLLVDGVYPSWPIFLKHIHRRNIRGRRPISSCMRLSEKT